MTHALLFDLDDTLIFESDFQASAIAAVTRHLTEVKGHAPAAVVRAIAEAGPPGTNDRFQSILSTLGSYVDRAAVEELIQVHRTHEPALAWQPDVPKMLDVIRGLDVKLGIVTDGFAETQRGKLRALGAESVFECIVVTDELGEGRRHWKPDPKPFLVACDRLGVPTTRAIYVGDNPNKDFHVSTVLPITTVRLFWEGAVYLDSPYLDGVREHHRIGALTELAAVLERIGVMRK